MKVFLFFWNGMNVVYMQKCLWTLLQDFYDVLLAFFILYNMARAA